jgi:hypothetical protein
LSVAVVIPWRNLNGCEHRQRAFECVMDFYDDLDYPVIVADCPDPFTKPRALNAAISALPPWTVIVQSDPDSYLARVVDYRRAIEAAIAEPGLVIPHDRYLYLTPEVTEEVLRGDRYDVGPDDCEESGGGGRGNVTVFSKETWGQAGRYDERFPVWGGDDVAFSLACEALVGPTRRLPGDLIHLWHPRQPGSIVGSSGYLDQFSLLAQYRDAAAVSRSAVRRLVRSRK